MKWPEMMISPRHADAGNGMRESKMGGKAVQSSHLKPRCGVGGFDMAVLVWRFGMGGLVWAVLAWGRKGVWKDGLGV